MIDYMTAHAFHRIVSLVSMEECASGTDFRTLIFLQFFANVLLVWIHF